MVDAVEFNAKRIRVAQSLQAVVQTLAKELPSTVFNTKDFYFAGGCIYSIWNDRVPKDYDLFCVSRYRVRKLKEYFKKYKPWCFTTNNAITFKCILNNDPDNIITVQFITQYIGPAVQEVLKFDFKHNIFYWNTHDGLVNCTDWDELNSTQLHFNTERARDVLNILTRVPKFVDRGMSITQNEIINILEIGTRPTKIFRERSYIKKRKKGKGYY